MKKILFVVNTMGRAGAEMALIELLYQLGGNDYELYLYVVMGQGELIDRVPPYVRLLNTDFDKESVLNDAGRRRMAWKVCRAFFCNGRLLAKAGFLVKNITVMIKNKNIQIDKLLWRVMSEGACRFAQSFDLAVAWLEGASAYYVSEHVKARKKAAFIHIDYENAGYTRELDQGCFAGIDRIFTVSDEVKKHFLAVYPEYENKTKVFHNMIDREKILRLGEESGGFSDDYEGVRLLTVGRLIRQKAYDVAIEAMKILKDEGLKVRWYVLGEGDQRKSLKKKIALLGLSEDFRLLGETDNPYPYYRQADLYVHATRYEGKSIAIQEAQILGCAVIASDCNGNREQITDGVDGILCELSPKAVAESIAMLCRDEEKRKRYGTMAQAKTVTGKQELQLIRELIED